MALVPMVGECRWESEGEAVPGQEGRIRGIARERWYAVQTRSRHEKRVAARLRGNGFHSYLPLVREIHRWSDRSQIVEVPLFSGYAFVRMCSSPENTLKVVQTDGVLNMVGALPHGTPIPDEEIHSIESLLKHEVPYVSYPFLKVGQRVRIRGGALDGIEGIMVARKGAASVVISIQMIQRSLAVPVEGYDVEVV